MFFIVILLRYLCGFGTELKSLQNVVYQQLERLIAGHILP